MSESTDARIRASASELLDLAGVTVSRDMTTHALVEAAVQALRDLARDTPQRRDAVVDVVQPWRRPDRLRKRKRVNTILGPLWNVPPTAPNGVRLCRRYRCRQTACLKEFCRPHALELLTSFCNITEGREIFSQDLAANAEHCVWQDSVDCSKTTNNEISPWVFYRFFKAQQRSVQTPKSNKYSIYIYGLLETGRDRITYVGATGNPIKRLKSHIPKYDKPITMRILEICNSDTWRTAEDKWIRRTSKTNSNKRQGGLGSAGPRGSQSRYLRQALKAAQNEIAELKHQLRSMGSK